MACTEAFSSLAAKQINTMKTSFGMIGLTREELYAQQLFLNVGREFPEQVAHLVAWLSAVREGKLPPSSYLPRHNSFVIDGTSSQR